MLKHQLFFYSIIFIFTSSSKAFKLNFHFNTKITKDTIDKNSTQKALKNTNGASPKYTFFNPVVDISNHQQQFSNTDTDDIDSFLNGNSFNNLPDDDFYENPLTSCGIRTVQFQPSNHHHYNHNHRRGRIIGGYEAPYGAFPWQVEIQLFNYNRRKFEHHCGGAVIHEKIVITAAHCLQISQLEYLRIIFGNHLLDEKDLFEHGFRVDEILIHPEYRKKGLYSNDIGLLKIRTSHKIGVPFNSHIRSICLPNRNSTPSPGTWCSVTGWGAHESVNLQSIAGALRAATVPILDLNTCRKNSVNGGRKQQILDTMLCAGFLQGGVDACGGDSGGPLACEINGRFVLTGIVSWGDGCAKRNRPGVYTRVDAYIDWIQKSIKQLTTV